MIGAVPRARPAHFEGSGSFAQPIMGPMAAGDGIDFDWQGKQRHIAAIMVNEPVPAWHALHGSGGQRRDPDRETTINPWPYPWVGVLVEIHPTGFREAFYAIDVGTERMFVNKYDEGVRVLKDSGPTLEP